MIVVQKTRVGVNMGDHAQDITEAHEVAPGETVEHLVERLLSRDVWKSLDLRTVHEPDHESYLVIRIAVPADTDEGNSDE